MTELLQAFAQQARACGNLGSPFMQRLLDMLARHWPADSALARKCATFSGDLGPAGVSLPLRIAGGLHALALRGHDLARLYPPNTATDVALRAGVLQVIEQEAAFLCDWIESPPQTNEIRRSALLIAGARVAGTQFDAPIVLSELGASAGLNLFWDHYALELDGTRFGPADPVISLQPDWEGPMPPARDVRVAQRRGVDLKPLDPGDKTDLLRMTAYLWPDQPERLKNTRAAAAVAAAVVDQGDAIDWLDQRLQKVPDGHLHLIQNTVAWQYFPAAAQDRGTRLIEAAGAAATAARPLAWLSFETDGDTSGLGGGGITLRLWPGDITLALGRADFHGRWVTWTGPSR